MPKVIAEEVILNAALTVLAEHGYSGATTRQIADVAGINEVTLFRRFGNKQKLLTAVVEREAAGFAASGIEHTGDVQADLVRIVRFYQDLARERGRMITMLMAEIPRHPEMLEVMQTPLTIIGKITEVMARYQREGVLVEEPPMQAFFALVGPLFLPAVLGAVIPDLIDAPNDPAVLVKHYLAGRRCDAAIRAD